MAGKSPAVTITRILKIAKKTSPSIIAVELTQTHNIVTFADGTKLHLTGWFEEPHAEKPATGG